MKLWNTERARELKRLLRLGAGRYIAEPVGQEPDAALKADSMDSALEPD